MTVIYVLVVIGLVAAAVLFSARESRRTGERAVGDAQLVAFAEDVLFAGLTGWDAPTRARQALGETVALSQPLLAPGIGRSLLFVTRLTSRVYALIVEITSVAGDASRRLSLLVRVPTSDPATRGALVSAGDVELGGGARIVVPDSATCGEAPPPGIVVAPGARVIGDGVAEPAGRPTVREDVAAADSLTYLRIAGTPWTELASGADVRLTAGAHITLAPIVEDGRCVSAAGNWGDPRQTAPPSVCERRVPIVFAEGDLTIDGGRGQGVLLVVGRLRLAGPLELSGQIVALGGIETIGDGVALSGRVLATSRAPPSDAGHGNTAAVSLRHAITLRYSGCDAQHGVASWLQPRPVRERAWAELF